MLHTYAMSGTGFTGFVCDVGDFVGTIITRCGSDLSPVYDIHNNRVRVYFYGGETTQGGVKGFYIQYIRIKAIETGTKTSNIIVI